MLKAIMTLRFGKLLNSNLKFKVKAIFKLASVRFKPTCLILNICLKLGGFITISLFMRFKNFSVYFMSYPNEF